MLQPKESLKNANLQKLFPKKPFSLFSISGSVYLSSARPTIWHMKKAKGEWLNEKYETIKKLQNTEIACMHKKIKEIEGQKRCSSA